MDIQQGDLIKASDVLANLVQIIKIYDGASNVTYTDDTSNHKIILTITGLPATANYQNFALIQNPATMAMFNNPDYYEKGLFALIKDTDAQHPVSYIGYDEGMSLEGEVYGTVMSSTDPHYPIFSNNNGTITLSIGYNASYNVQYTKFRNPSEEYPGYLFLW